MAQQVRRAAALTAELPAKLEKEVSEVCSHPPDLHDEPAAAALQPTCSLSLVNNSPLPVGQSFNSHSRRFRGGQPRPATRAQEVAALGDETLSFFVKATDKDKASMRPKFEDVKLENFRRERDRWRTRAEEKQRLQDKKEEAWELFQRQPRLEPKSEREYQQKVTSAHKYSPVGSCDTPWQIEERSTQAWVEDLPKTALAQNQKKEARVRQSMGQ